MLGVLGPPRPAKPDRPRFGLSAPGSSSENRNPDGCDGGVGRGGSSSVCFQSKPMFSPVSSAPQWNPESCAIWRPGTYSGPVRPTPCHSQSAHQRSVSQRVIGRSHNGATIPSVRLVHFGQNCAVGNRFSQDTRMAAQVATRRVARVVESMTCEKGLRRRTSKGYARCARYRQEKCVARIATVIPERGITS